MLSLYGTLTSPFVRRVRIVAAELGIDVTLHDINEPGAQAEMRALSPIWKVPVATWRGETLLDSHTITELLLARFGPGPLLPFDPLDAGARNAIAVADGAADALINVLYLGRDAIAVDQSAYLRKQQERAAAALTWLDARIDRGRVRTDDLRGHAGAPQGVGLVEIALFTALDWMRFRQAYPIDRHANLLAFLAIHAERPSFANTRPIA
jgi:glutathione S-transferase